MRATFVFVPLTDMSESSFTILIEKKRQSARQASLSMRARQSWHHVCAFWLVSTNRPARLRVGQPIASPKYAAHLASWGKHVLLASQLQIFLSPVNSKKYVPVTSSSFARLDSLRERRPVLHRPPFVQRPPGGSCGSLEGIADNNTKAVIQTDWHFRKRSSAVSSQ